MSLKFVPYITRCWSPSKATEMPEKSIPVSVFKASAIIGMAAIMLIGFITYSNREISTETPVVEEKIVESQAVPEMISAVTSDPITEETAETVETAPLTRVIELSDVSYAVPSAETGAKRWMDYRHITARSSMQWKLQQDAWTDEYGFRRYGDYYMIAMGTYYADQCGKIFEITLENGFTFYGLISDIKQNRHTDSLNQHRNGNVVEFIIDKDKIPTMAKKMGDMSYAFDEMNAKIKTIKEVVSVKFVRELPYQACLK